MRKPLLAAIVLALTLFGVGYLIGQVRGVASSAAATAPNSFTAGTFTQPEADRGAAPRIAASAGKHADGTVTAINGNSITVKADNDAANLNEYTSVTTILLTGSTQYPASGGKSAIKVGSRVVAEGTVSSDGKTLTASSVSVGGAGGCPHGGQPSGTSSGPGA